MNPKISIITINYNNLHGLKRTVESVLKQDCNEFEYIIIDGGSTDGSMGFLQRESNKIDYWVSETDKGIYHAMNKGIESASGDFLLFLNSGDYFPSNTVLQEALPELKDNDILYGDMIKVLKDNREIIDNGPQGKPLTLQTFIEGSLNHCSTFIRKDLFFKYGLYDEQLKIVSDWKFFLIAIGLNESKTQYINKVISVFNVDGISSTQLSLCQREREKVLQEIIPKPILLDYPENHRNQIRTKRREIFDELEKSPRARKFNSLLLPVLLYLFRGKTISRLND